MTRTIPTNKYGEVYYGPRTYAEAEAILDEAADNPAMDANPAKIADQLEDAGYTGIARRIRREYNVD